MSKDQNIAYVNKSATPPHTVIGIWYLGQNTLHHDKIIWPLMDILLSFKKCNNVPLWYDSSMVMLKKVVM